MTMKKIKYFAAALLFPLLFSGCDVNEQFDGLEDMANPTNKAAYVYTLATADYSAISSAALKVASNHEDTVKAQSINTYKAFSDKVFAGDYIPFLLKTKYKYGDIGSTAAITYAFGQNKPSFSIISKSDYQYLWGDSFLNYVEAFTPAKSADANLNAVLKNKFPVAVQGDYKLLEYNYSSVEASTSTIEYKYFYDNFDSYSFATSSPYTVIGVEHGGWTQKDTVLASDKGKYYGRVYSGNKYAQITSNGTNQKNDVFLITKKIDLTQAINPEFTFDLNVGYWKADCLNIYISEDYDGDVNHIGDATWVDLTSNFTLPQVPTGGYGTFANAGEADLTSYVGKEVYIAFKYSGDSRATTPDPKPTTTYQIDNVKVSEMRDALSVPSSEKQYVAYNFDGEDWVKSSEKFDVVQPADYTAMGLSFISSANVPIYIPNFLKQKYPYALEGDMRNVVYLSAASTTSVTQFVFTNGTWVANDFVIEETAMFKFKEDGWKFVDSDILVGLNANTQISSNLGDFLTFNVSGAQVWAWNASGYMKMSGYSGGNLDNEDWLVSPAMNLSERGDSVFLTFTHVGNYFTDKATMKQYVKVYVSTTSDGSSINPAEWTELNLSDADYSAGNNWTFVTTTPIKLGAYKGQPNVRIGFKYVSTTSLAGTWEIKDVYVYEKEE